LLEQRVVDAGEIGHCLGQVTRSLLQLRLILVQPRLYLNVTDACTAGRPVRSGLLSRGIAISRE
jgi:hypothetical protein